MFSSIAISSNALDSRFSAEVIFWTLHKRETKMYQVVFWTLLNINCNRKIAEVWIPTYCFYGFFFLCTIFDRIINVLRANLTPLMVRLARETNSIFATCAWLSHFNILNLIHLIEAFCPFIFCHAKLQTIEVCALLLQFFHFLIIGEGNRWDAEVCNP